MQLGDFATGSTVRFLWSTNAADGSSITRGTNGEVRVYIDGGLTQLTTGVTDTEDFDSLTGVHLCAIDLSSSASYAAGSECDVVLQGAVIDGKTVNAVLAHFSIERAGGALALLKGANGLAAIKTQTGAIETDTQDLQARTPAALVGGRMDASVGAMAANVMTAAAAAADLTTELQAGLATAANLATLQTSVDDLPTNAELATALAGADDAVLAQVALVKAKTDALPADPADASDIAAAFSSVNSTLATIAGYLDTEIAAIKAKTDLLPADPASQAIIIAATDALAVLSAAIKAKTDSLAFTSGRVHADTKAVAGVVLQQNGSGTQSIGGP